MGKLWTRREKPPAPLRPVPAPASAEPRLLGYVDHDWVSPLAGAYYSWGRCFSAACVEGEEGHHHMESLVPITPEQFAAARAAGWESQRPVPKLRFKVHAVIQMEERGLSVEDVRAALANGEDIESRPDEEPYPARVVLGFCQLGALHVAVRDNIEDDEIIVETAYQPDPALWEPDFKTRRMSQ